MLNLTELVNKHFKIKFEPDLVHITCDYRKVGGQSPSKWNFSSCLT